MFANYTEKLNELVSLSKQEKLLASQKDNSTRKISEICSMLLNDSILLNYCSNISRTEASVIDNISAYDVADLESSIGCLRSDLKFIARLQAKLSELRSGISSTSFDGLLAKLDVYQADMQSAHEFKQLIIIEQEIDQLLKMLNELKQVDKQIAELDVVMTDSHFGELYKIFLSHKKNLSSYYSHGLLSKSCEWINHLWNKKSVLVDIGNKINEFKVLINDGFILKHEEWLASHVKAIEQVACFSDVESINLIINQRDIWICEIKLVLMEIGKFESDPAALPRSGFSDSLLSKLRVKLLALEQKNTWMNFISNDFRSKIISAYKTFDTLNSIITVVFVILGIFSFVYLNQTIFSFKFGFVLNFFVSVIGTGFFLIIAMVIFESIYSLKNIF